MASAVDDDTKRAVAQGRATVGSLLTNARDDLRKSFLVFVVGFMGTFWALRLFIWDMLKRDLNTDPNTEIIAVTPFDVILLQAKIGLFVGVLMAIPTVVYYGRDALRARGWWPAEDIPRWKLVFPVTLSIVLFVGGIAYSYYVFFPVMLGFLAGNAVNAGLQPSWSIVKWTQFIAFLGLSFGIAAQLPLMMSGLSYLRIVSYEAFRERWRHAVVAIFVFGAFFSPPDPITQIMWAVPLIILYAFSLQLARFAELLRRSTDELQLPLVARAHWNQLAGAAVLAGAVAYFFLTRGGVAALNDLVTYLPEDYQVTVPTPGEATGLDPQIAAGIVAAVVGAIAAGIVLFVFASRALEAARDPYETRGSPADIDPMTLAPSPPRALEAARDPYETRGSPADIDLMTLDASAIGVTPPERFEEMDEGEATELAREALHDHDDPEKAQAILDRYDEVQERLEAEEEAEAEDGDGASAGAEDESGAMASTTTGVVDSFTEGETTEEDIGGYYYDIAFILESLTSRAFRIVGLFGVVMAASFIFLYRGGIGMIREEFLRQMPQTQAQQVEIVALHPVEALIFAIKFSTLLGAVATLPLILYYLWPRLKERGLVGGDRRVLVAWGGTLLVGMVGGSLLGFFVVAPAIISYLAQDAVEAHMIINYRINNIGWLVVFTTVGIGLLAEIPVTMLLFHRGGLVTFTTMFDRWRSVVMAIVVTAALVTPSSLLTMLVFALPIAVAYLVGLAVLWVYTLGGRRTPRREGKAAD